MTRACVIASSMFGNNWTKPLLSFRLIKELGIISELAEVKSATLRSVGNFPMELAQQTVISSNQPDSQCEPHVLDADKENRLASLNCPSEVTECLRRNFAVFDNGGLIKGVEFKIEVTEGAKPYAPPARRLPPALLPLVKAELDRLCDAGIIYEVTEPTEWCSPTVVALKKDQTIRLCTDLRVLNSHIKRHHLQMHTIEEISASVRGATVFSVIDLQGGFQQIEVAKESQAFLAFSTPFGRYCHRRLPYGISSAPEFFQKAMNNLLLDIPGVACFIDDCLIYGKDLPTHNEILEKVLVRLREHGVRLNMAKCKFAQTSVEYIGHLWSADGIAPHPKKLAAIASMERPTTGESLRSFLGLASYIGSKTVPNFSALAGPLWDLGSSGPLRWSATASNAFNRLKGALLDIQNLQYFDPSLPVVVQVDASGYGLGGVILQNDKPVVFASRKLTPVESRYSQLEKEFLSIVFTLTHLKNYLLGISFIVQTDHRPLLGIIGKPIDKISNRLQRWLLNIQHFRFELQHIAGKSNLLADALLRNSNKLTAAMAAENCEYTICFLLKCYAIDLEQIANATAEDNELQKVITCIDQGWSPQSRKVHPYYSLRNELSLKVCNSKRGHKSVVVMKGDQVIVPKSLVPDMLTQLHEGHAGSSKMKQLLRSCAYWPGFSSDIDEHVHRCSACTVFQTKSDTPAFTPIVENFTEPYARISLDLTGPSVATHDKTILTIVDYFSRYPEAFVLRYGHVGEILQCLRQTFSRYGLPKSVVTDNGSVFRSHELANFFKSLGILHIFSSNYHPQSNGAVERFYGTLKSRIKRILHDKQSTWDQALDRVLYDIRSSPNAITGDTPFQRFFGRPMRTKFVALSETPKIVEAAPRNATREYMLLHRGRAKDYHVGDKVFFRKTKGSPCRVVISAHKHKCMVHICSVYCQFSKAFIERK